jgi:hypothetical protein
MIAKRQLSHRVAQLRVNGMRKPRMVDGVMRWQGFRSGVRRPIAPKSEINPSND